MKLINPEFEIIEQQPGLEGMYKHIEYAARICYRSEDKITDDSYEKLLKCLGNNGHYSPYAHGTVYMVFNFFSMFKFLFFDLADHIFHFCSPMWTRIKYSDFKFYVTTNYRVIKELNLLDIVKPYIVDEPTEYHEKRHTVKITFSRVQATSLNRHATSLAICGESTRYCSYDKGKFDSEIKYIKPIWYDEASDENKELFNKLLKADEDAYMTMLKELKPEFARDILPLDLATTLVYTGYADAWKHIFDLRCSNSAHPEIRKIMLQIKEKFIKNNFIKP